MAPRRGAWDKRAAMGDESPGPYRDERDGLRDEVERLRRENRSLKGDRYRWTTAVFAAVVLGAMDLWLHARVVERLNAHDDARFWAGVLMLASLVALHVAVAVRLLGRR